MKYMLLFYIDRSNYVDPSDPRHPGRVSRHAAVTREAQQRGAFYAGAGLQGPATATTVRVREGKTLMTDGPFAETKELLAGFEIHDCADLDEVIAYAAKLPDALEGSVEIRPVDHMAIWPCPQGVLWVREGIA